MGPHAHHTIDYIEIGVTDMDAAMAFYSAAFGCRWSTTAPTTRASRATARRSAASGGMLR
jgi:uncharacterized protein